jgi:hypothetical protein
MEDIPTHPADTLATAPFLVVYHFRHNSSHHPKPRFPRPLRPSVPSHSIILTRKMAAKLDAKNHPEPKQEAPTVDDPQPKDLPEER